ncbi:MAG: FUSC family protein [Proteobacteria bacterium]|nr:FUSC family protein [Pseudomonadota bacterium]
MRQWFFWHRLPAYAVNGIAVALGIALIQLLATLIAGPAAAPLVVSGAICTSLPDQPNHPARTWHRVSAAALLTFVAALAIDIARPYPMALGIAIGIVAFASMLAMAWGARAGAVSFSPILSMIFAMAVPPTGHPLSVAMWSAFGGLAYLAWAMLSNTLLQRRYRTLALAAAVAGAADLFRSRGRVLGAAGRSTPGERAAEAWIRGESELADRLQAARDVLFAAPDTPHWRRDVAILLRVIDLRDILIASPLDVELLGHDDATRTILDATAASLAEAGRGLDLCANALRDGVAPAPITFAVDAFARRLESAPLAPGDARLRLIAPLRDRMQRFVDDVQRIQRLAAGADEPLPLTHAQLMQFVAAEGWPLSAVAAQMNLGSPVLRHALRSGIALALAYYIGLVLPWGAHAYWLVLSVAVVLRGTLGETLARRNARVAGTVLGCLIVVAVASLDAPLLVKPLFFVALGAAHAFAIRRYWMTAMAASVMALLQAHFVSPEAGFPIVERIADTLLGAALAWSLSYVLPSWERQAARRGITRIAAALMNYASYALHAREADPVAERLARRQAYDALQALTLALQRSHVEPRAVRLPAADVSALLDHGERLMAHLSMVRLLLAQVGDETPESVAHLLAKCHATLKGALDLQLPAPAAPTTARVDGLALLPERPARADLLPWLARRLHLLSAEALRLREMIERVRPQPAAAAPATSH